jgi:hypothetical protein
MARDVVLSLIRERGAQSCLIHRGAAVPIPGEIESLFAEDDRYLLTFVIGNVPVDCHFFETDEIELSFAPDAVDEASLRALVEFMVEIGTSLRKTVILTREDVSRKSRPETPIFVYDPNTSDVM